MVQLTFWLGKWDFLLYFTYAYYKVAVKHIMRFLKTMLKITITYAPLYTVKTFAASKSVESKKKKKDGSHLISVG